MGARLTRRTRAEALQRHAESDIYCVTDTGSLRGDLRATVDGISRVITGEDGPSLLGLLEALRADPALRDLVRTQITHKSREAGRVLLDRAGARGEVIRDVEPQLVLDLAVAQLLMRALLVGAEPDTAFRSELVDKILLPLLTGCFDSAASTSARPRPGPSRSH